VCVCVWPIHAADTDATKLMSIVGTGTEKGGGVN